MPRGSLPWKRRGPSPDAWCWLEQSCCKKGTYLPSQGTSGHPGEHFETHFVAWASTPWRRVSNKRRSVADDSDSRALQVRSTSARKAMARPATYAPSVRSCRPRPQPPAGSRRPSSSSQKPYMLDCDHTLTFLHPPGRLSPQAGENNRSRSSDRFSTSTGDQNPDPQGHLQQGFACAPASRSTRVPDGQEDRPNVQKCLTLPGSGRVMMTKRGCTSWLHSHLPAPVTTVTAQPGATAMVTKLTASATPRPPARKSYVPIC